MPERSGQQLLWGLGLFALLCLSGTLPLHSQEFEIVDRVLQDIDLENSRQVDWLEYLWELKNNPLNLNRARVRDLLRLPFLTPQIAREIVRHRRRKGGFRSLEELKQLPGITEELYTALKPFITVQEPAPMFSATYRVQAGLTFPTPRGFERALYQDPLWLNQRFYFRRGNTLQGGIIWDKDPGESNYFDFGSYHLSWQNLPHRFRLTVGDYYLLYGAGLVYWSPFGLPLYPELLPILRIPETILRNNRSAAPTGFLRGINLSKAFGKAGIVRLFFSSRRLDATISSTDSTVSHLYLSGLHRTPGEKSKQNRLQETILGGVLEGRLGKARLQGLFSRNRLRPALKGQPGAFSSSSVALQVPLGKLTYSAEWSLYNLRFPALTNQLYLERSNFRYQFTFYYYHPDYFTLRGRALGSFSQTPTNKTGAALLVRYSPWKRTRFSAYLHAYRPLRTPETPTTVLRDYYLSVTQTFAAQQLSLRFKQKDRSLNEMLAGETEKHYYGLQLTYRLKISPEVHLQSRLESRWVTPLPPAVRPYGFSLSHQLDWRVRRTLRLLFRWTIFDVPDYEMRIYEFEPDLPGNFFLQLLNGRGYKFLVLCHWKANQQLQFHLKWQWRYYPDLTVLGSGLDLIKQNWVQQWRLSLIWKI